MIMDVETTFCKMYEQFQAMVTKLQKAVEENTPIHQVEETLVEDLRTLGRSAVEAFIERQGDGDIGEAVEHEGHTLKRLPEVVVRPLLFGVRADCGSSNTATRRALRRRSS